MVRHIPAEQASLVAPLLDAGFIQAYPIRDSLPAFDLDTSIPFDITAPLRIGYTPACRNSYGGSRCESRNSYGTYSDPGPFHGASCSGGSFGSGAHALPASDGAPTAPTAAPAAPTTIPPQASVRPFAAPTVPPFPALRSPAMPSNANGFAADDGADAVPLADQANIVVAQAATDTANKKKLTAEKKQAAATKKMEKAQAHLAKAQAKADALVNPKPKPKPMPKPKQPKPEREKSLPSNAQQLRAPTEELSISPTLQVREPAVQLAEGVHVLRMRPPAVVAVEPQPKRAKGTPKAAMIYPAASTPLPARWPANGKVVTESDNQVLMALAHTTQCPATCKDSVGR